MDEHIVRQIECMGEDYFRYRRFHSTPPPQGILSEIEISLRIRKDAGVCSRIKAFEGIPGMREFGQPVEIAESFCGGQRQR
jgi:hypothetical protein